MLTKDNFLEKLDQYRIPRHKGEYMASYIFEHNPTGSFLTALFSNDLHGSFRCADDENRDLLHNYCMFFHNELPMPSYGPGVSCWGNKENVKAWTKEFDDV
jgi:hypothetical protein